MDIKKITEELNRCLETEMTDVQKYHRATILSAALRKANRDQLYEKYKMRVKEQGKKLEEQTSGSFKLDKNIVTTEMSLRNYIVNSNVADFLVKKGMSECTFDELYASSKEFDANVVRAIQLYQSIEKLGNIERDAITTLAIDLSEIFGYQIMSEGQHKFVISKQGKVKIITEEKTLEQYIDDEKRVFEMISKLKLGEVVNDYVCELVHQIFDYYKDGNKEILSDYDEDN